MEPVAAGWRSAKNIIVVPHGILGRLPFSLLVTKATAQPQERPDAPRFAGYRDVPFLIRDTTVTHVPSVDRRFVSLHAVPDGAAKAGCASRVLHRALGCGTLNANAWQPEGRANRAQTAVTANT